MPRVILPQLLVIAAFSRHDAALAWARERITYQFGPIILASEPFLVDEHTTYYQPTMGTGLQKVLLALERLVMPETLPDLKRTTIGWELELAACGRFPEPRPLNLDPGLLSLGKFILATTKDQAHRIYLRDGIFAEVTLRYQDEQFQSWPWTYRDYRQPAVLEFLKQSRACYRGRLGTP
jgi:hypothetical protein